jgi:hypothetical protein
MAGISVTSKNEKIQTDHFISAQWRRMEGVQVNFHALQLELSPRYSLGTRLGQSQSQK